MVILLIINGLFTEYLGDFVELFEFKDSKIKLMKHLYFMWNGFWPNKIGWIENKNVILQFTNNQKGYKYLLLRLKQHYPITPLFRPV